MSIYNYIIKGRPARVKTLIKAKSPPQVGTFVLGLLLGYGKQILAT